MIRKALLSAAAIIALHPAAAPAQRALSTSERQQGAQAHPQLLQEYGGAYAGPQAALVRRVGLRMAAASGVPQAEGQFTVTLLNSPVENAFAIPGGYVYVTRQLLGLMNSEAELASVLGHEVGHVAARHAQSRNTRATITNVLAQGLGVLTGSQALGQLAGTGAQLYTLGYSRSQEYQADALGIRYMTATGYTPYAAADMLQSLDEAAGLAAAAAGRDAKATPGWASTHPNGAERVSRAQKLAQQSGRPDTSEAQDTAFLRQLDGLPVDDDPQQGVVDGQTFRHPGLRLQLTAPAGYRIANGADAVTVAGQGGQAVLRARTGQSSAADEVRRQFAALNAGNAAANLDIRPLRSGGGDTAYATVRASAGGRAVDATVIAWAWPSSMIHILAITPAGQGIGPFGGLIDSVRTLTPAEASRITGRRIRVVSVGASDTVDTLARRMAYDDRQRDRFLILNGLADDVRLAPGRLVKIVARD